MGIEDYLSPGGGLRAVGDATRLAADGVDGTFDVAGKVVKGGVDLVGKGVSGAVDGVKDLHDSGSKSLVGQTLGKVPIVGHGVNIGAGALGALVGDNSSKDKDDLKDMTEKDLRAGVPSKTETLESSKDSTGKLPDMSGYKDALEGKQAGSGKKLSEKENVQEFNSMLEGTVSAAYEMGKRDGQDPNNATRKDMSKSESYFRDIVKNGSNNKYGKMLTKNLDSAGIDTSSISPGSGDFDPKSELEASKNKEAITGYLNDKQKDNAKTNTLAKDNSKSKENDLMIDL